ncbi:MAG: phenylacetate-CoA oxygenase subunit PaaC [Bacteroidia bacterium]|nr:phenylacetate-CoA oxygenase subunit PaaC [Bacteroidia bacterium]
MKHQEALLTLTLRLGDNPLVLGHRLGEWCSKAPILEEDLALTNMALDMIGRAEVLLRYAALIEGKNHTEDDLAYKRGERKFYNHLIVEQPNGNFAFTIARQLYVSLYEFLYYSELMNSKDETLSAIAHKAIKEIKYHLKHASDWTIRLGDGTDERHHKMQEAINELWMFTGELFESDEVDEQMSELGIAPYPADLIGKWKTELIDILSEAKLSLPEESYMQTGSRNGIHTEYLGYILADMQYLQRAYPNAKW